MVMRPLTDADLGATRGADRIAPGAAAHWFYDPETPHNGLCLLPTEPAARFRLRSSCLMPVLRSEQRDDG
jgi:hypothetical protein